MDEVGRLRRRIDGIDQQIVHLLGLRYETARSLGQAKKTRGLPLRDSRRERTILRRVEALASKEELSPRLMRVVFRQIFRMSVRAQSQDSSGSRSVLSGLNVGVVGTGGMGQLFARFASRYGASVKIAGRSIARSRSVAENLGVDSATPDETGESDIVIVTVPMEATADVCLRISNHMSRGTLLMDISSVKMGITDRIVENLSTSVEYVSLHPLFGPDVASMQGQDFVAVSHRNGVRWERFSRALRIAGVKIHLTAAEDHDRAMAYVQGLHHLALVALGLGLKGWDGSYRTNSLRDTLERIRSLLQNWETVAGIQGLNPYVPKARKEFVRIAGVLADRGFPNSVLAELRSNVQKWSRKQ